MNKFNVRGIVIKEVLLRESDKIITILCKDIGKISAYSKGSRKSKSKLLAGSQLFSYCDFTINEGKSLFFISQIDIIENFYNIRNDFYRLCYGSYFFELIDRIILPNSPCDDILQLLLKALTKLKKDEYNPELVARIFELKFLEYDGYMPETNLCVICETDLDENTYFVADGTVCELCSRKERAYKISPSTLHTIRYILTAELKNLFSFKVSDSVLAELKAVSKLYIDNEYKFKSLSLLE